MSDVKLMNMAEYARHRGVKTEAVRYAIKVGKLKNSLHYKRENGIPYIDPAVADGEWVLEIRASRADAGIDSGSPGGGGAPTIADSRARKEAADAELAELKLEREKGRLVDAEEVKKTAFKVARAVRDQMLNIPDRVAAELAAETDVFKINKRLTDEIRKALELLEIKAEET